MTEQEAPDTVFLIDDDSRVVENTRWLLERSGHTVEIYSDASQVSIPRLMEHAGCVVLDVKMPRMCGLGFLEKVVEAGSKVPILFLTGHGDVSRAVKAMKLGARDFLEKPYDPRELLEKVEEALEAYREDRLLERRRQRYAERFAQLTERERQVAALVAAGLTSKEVGRNLNLSPRTVDAHRFRLMAKMAAQSVAH
ncbi:MAG TPA: response regulator, partial [Gammaproteobacteria bacterium]|nr:response regulator [Gammaproteobacteria bacterium]